MMKGAAVTMTDLQCVVDSLLSRNAEVSSRTIIRIEFIIISELTMILLKMILFSQIQLLLCFQRIYNKMVSLGSIGLTLHRPRVVALDWTQPCEALSGQTFDLILLTDCIFSVTLTDALIETILRYSTSRTEIICCHEIRDEDANRAFVTSLKKHCNVKQISSHKLHPEFKSNEINIFSAKLKRKK